MNVAPIPEQLQKRIEDAFDTESPDEILKLFSKEHIQKLYSAFLGVSGSSQDASEIEPFWGRIQDIIRDHDSDRDSKLPTPPKPKVTAAGLSRTMLEHTTQLATNMTNIWSGSIMKKMIDHLLRILLRIHLAPNREKHIQETAKAYRAKQNPSQEGQSLKASSSEPKMLTSEPKTQSVEPKMPSTEPKMPPSEPKSLSSKPKTPPSEPKLSSSQWRRRVLELSDELAKYASGDLSKHPVRVAVVLDKLRAVGDHRPNPIQTKIESLEVRQEKAAKATLATAQPQAQSSPTTSSPNNGEKDVSGE